MLRHFGLCVGLSLGLGHFSVVEFWSMQGVSDALLGHAALRLCWPYLRLTLSNIQAMLGCCCVPLSPCCADVWSPTEFWKCKKVCAPQVSEKVRDRNQDKGLATLRTFKKNNFGNNNFRILIL